MNIVACRVRSTYILPFATHNPFPDIFARIERLLKEADAELPEHGGGASGRRKRRLRVTLGSASCLEYGKEQMNLLGCRGTFILQAGQRPCLG